MKTAFRYSEFLLWLDFDEKDTSSDLANCSFNLVLGNELPRLIFCHFRHKS